MYRTPLHLLTATLAFGLALSWSCPDVSAKRLVVLKFKGDRRSKIAKSLQRLIDNEHKIIDGSTYELKARELNATRMSARNVRKVATRLEADGVLLGKIRRQRGRYVLTLALYEGSSGKTVKKLTVKLRNRRLSRKMRKAIVKRLMVAIDELAFVENTDDAIKEEDGGTSKIKSDDGGNDNVGEKEKDDDNEKISSVGSVSKSSGDSKPNGAMWVSAGLSVISRSLSFSSDPALGDQAPKGYQGPMAPGIVVQGEVFPMAMDGKEKGSLANLGFGFVYDQVVSINTILQDPAGGMNITLPTSQSQWGVQVKYRHVFNPKMQLKVSMGYNRMSFQVDRSPLAMGQVLDLPDTSYTYFDPGLTLRYKASPKMTIALDGRALLVTNAGSIQTPEEYGSATVTGFDAGVQVSYLVKPRIVLNIGARYMAIGYAFNGDGDQTKLRDNDAATIDVGGALDAYMRGTVSLAYLF